MLTTTYVKIVQRTQEKKEMVWWALAIVSVTPISVDGGDYISSSNAPQKGQ